MQDNLLPKQENETTKLDYLDLWKYFSNDAARIKDKLWTIASWLFTLLSGLLGFIAKGFKPETFAFEAPKLVIVVAGVGMVLSAYAYWMIMEYGWHIRTAWNRTDFLRSKIEGLEEVWQAGHEKNEEKKTSLRSRIIQFLVLYFVFFSKRRMEMFPPFTHRLLALCVLFGTAFLGMWVLAIIQI